MTVLHCVSTLAQRRLPLVAKRWSSSSAGTVWSSSSPASREQSTLSISLYEDPIVVDDLKLSDCGTFLYVGFDDSTFYRFSTTWIKDALPNVSDSAIATNAVIQDESILSLSFASSQDAKQQQDVTINSHWLKAYAPFVAQPLSENATTDEPSPLLANYSMLDNSVRHVQPWTAHQMKQLPRYDARRVLSGDVDYQLDFIESLVDPGVVMVEHVPRGMSLESIVSKLVFSVEEENEEKDDTLMNSSNIFVQLMSTTTTMKDTTVHVCDGLAIAEQLRVDNPELFQLLSSSDGPIVLGNDGRIERILFDATTAEDDVELHDAITSTWNTLLQDPRFNKECYFPHDSLLVTNTWRVIVIARENAATTTTITRNTTEQHYRHLKLQQAGYWMNNGGGGESALLKNVPNQVLRRLADS